MLSEPFLAVTLKLSTRLVGWFSHGIGVRGVATSGLMVEALSSGIVEVMMVGVEAALERKLNLGNMAI